MSAANSVAGRVAMAGIGVLLIGAALAYVLAHRPDPADRPYLVIIGGGFIFNYRVADAFYGFTAKVARPIPIGTVIEAEFEDPAGGAPIVVRQQTGRNQTQYMLRTPPLTGIKKDTPYHVDIRLRARAGDDILWSTQKVYTSDIGEEVMPDGPLTIGPGYHRPPPPGAAPVAPADKP